MLFTISFLCSAVTLPFKRKCPFHADGENFNLQLYDASATFYCFSCKIRGDAFNLVAKVQSISNAAAIRWVQSEFAIAGRLSYSQPEKCGIDGIAAEIHACKKINCFIKFSSERVLRVLWTINGAGKWFFISLEEIARLAGITRKTAAFAIDRLRWCHFIEALLFAFCPSKSRRPLRKARAPAIITAS